MRRPRRQWTAAEIELLFGDYEGRLARLARCLGRSPDSVTSQARRMGLRRRRLLASQTDLQAAEGHEIIEETSKTI